MPEENYDIIDQYLANKLVGSTLSAFEQRLATEPAFQQEVADRRAMHNFVINLEKTKAFKAKLEGLEQKYFTPDAELPKPVQPAKKFPWFWLGLIALALIAFLLYKYAQPAPAPISYPQMAMHEPLELTQKSNDAAATALFELSNLYNEANYDKALPLINSYLTNHADDNEVLLAKGICELELDNIAAARKTFESISTGGSIYREWGTWYLALSYLKVGDQEKMKSYLRQIPETATGLYEKAQKILQQ